MEVIYTASLHQESNQVIYQRHQQENASEQHLLQQPPLTRGKTNEPTTTKQEPPSQSQLEHFWAENRLPTT